MKKHSPIILLLCFSWIVGMMFVSTGGISFEKSKIINDSAITNCFIGIDDLDYSLDNDLYSAQTCADTGDVGLNFPNQYFRKLSYHGINKKGTCAYVALGMFLSYYDTYWNDNIIPEQYDRQSYLLNKEYDGYINSPGIFDELSSDDSVYANDRSYESYMLSQQETNFHAYLLSLGKSMGYFGIGIQGSFGLSLANMFNLINRYTEIYPAADSNNFYYSYVNHVNDSATYTASMLQEIKTYVKLGQIVIVAIEGNDTEKNERVAHAIVAYDYDEDTDTLYGHFGWNSSYNHTNVLGSVNKYNFDRIQGYIVASPYESSHSHSNNYLLFSGDTVCSCQLSSHEHRYHYDSATETQHRRYCYCGVSSYQAHVFSGSSGRFVFCEKCKYRKLNDGGIIGIPNPCSTTPEILEDMEKIHEMLHNLNLEHRCC